MYPRVRKSLFVVLLLLVLALPVGANSATNMLTNADFETGDLTGWTAFGGAFHSTETGGNAAKLFGNFSGGFNVSGIFQEFSAAPGDQFKMDADSFHLSSDPMIGGGAPDSNWVVMKIAYFDAGNNEISGDEGTILDAASATDTWIDNAVVEGTAPAGTVKVQALILYLQPMFDGGAAHIDNVSFEKVDPSAIQLSGFETVTVATNSLLVILAFGFLLTMSLKATGLRK